MNIRKIPGFRSDRRGVSVIIFALSVLPLMGIVALAVDFAGVTAAKIKLDSAADAGLLAGVTTAANSVITNPSAYLMVGKVAGTQRFLAQAGQVISANTPVPALSVTRSGNKIVGTITWTTTYNTFLGAVVGVPSWPISGTATASTMVSAPFLSIEILLDNSGSMEIGATPSDIATMEELTACSVSGVYDWTGGSGNSGNTGGSIWNTGNNKRNSGNSGNSGSSCTSWVQSSDLDASSPYNTTFSSGQTYDAYACSSGSYSYTGSPACPLVGTTLGGVSYPNFPASGNQPSAVICPSLIPKPSPTTPNYSYNGYSPVAGPPCAFACHFDSNSPAGTGTDFYALARGTIGTSYQVTLRFDQVKAAVNQVITAMQSDNITTLNNLAVGVFWFADIVNQVYPTDGTEAGNDWTTAISDVGGPASVAYGQDTGIQPYVGANGGNTDFPAIMTSLATTLTASGTGASAASPQKVLFIVTDGLQDPASRAISAFDASSCAQFKAMGYAIYVLYTPYYSLMNGYFLSGTSPSVAEITAESATATDSIPYNLQQCASSPGNYIQASDTPGIAAALQTFLKQALTSPARFTR